MIYNRICDDNLFLKGTLHLVSNNVSVLDIGINESHLPEEQPNDRF